MKVASVDPKMLKQWMDEDKAIVIDVREKPEFSRLSLPGAHLFPLSTFDPQQILQLAEPSKHLVLHCQAGKRALIAAEKLLKTQNIDTLWNLEGGIAAWKKAKYPVIEASASILPIERQLQLVISLIILSGLLLHYTYTPWGLLLPLIAGLGLLNAALSGWCGMMKFLYLMPWNKG